MSKEQQLTFLGHLAELRGRLIKSLLAILITTVLCFVFADQVFRILIRPVGKASLIYIEVTEMFGTYIQVAIAGGVILGAPYLLYHFLMFVAPGLTSKERKYVWVMLPWATFMFIGGVLFGYFVLLPPAIGFLVTFGSDIASPQIRISNYVSVVVRLLVATGFVFEAPLVTTFMAKIGILRSGWLAHQRRWAVLLAFIIAAIITPTFDPVNQTLVAVPLIVLYELSIWLARLVQPK